MGCAPCPIPCRGSTINILVLEMIVMEPTAISPPYDKRELLKQINKALSVACMTKVESPKARQGRITGTLTGRNDRFKRSSVFFPVRKWMIQMVENAWEMMVAQAAPRTPMPRAKMNTGSRMQFEIAPISTENIPVVVYPWAMINAFIPSVN